MWILAEQMCFERRGVAFHRGALCYKKCHVCPAKLALADGTVFTGFAFGASGEVFGEVVFNTSMTGYQEILTDPSYCGQIVTMTYPLIGNYGINVEDVESPAFRCPALSSASSVASRAITAPAARSTSIFATRVSSAWKGSTPGLSFGESAFTER